MATAQSGSCRAGFLGIDVFLRPYQDVFLVICDFSGIDAQLSGGGGLFHRNVESSRVPISLLVVAASLESGSLTLGRAAGYRGPPIEAVVAFDI